MLPGDILNKLLYCSSSNDNVGTAHEGISYTLSSDCTNKGTAVINGFLCWLVKYFCHTYLGFIFLGASNRGTRSWRLRSLLCTYMGLKSSYDLMRSQQLFCACEGSPTPVSQD